MHGKQAFALKTLNVHLIRLTVVHFLPTLFIFNGFV
jgi:hypothetical protein